VRSAWCDNLLTKNKISTRTRGKLQKEGGCWSVVCNMGPARRKERTSAQSYLGKVYPALFTNIAANQLGTAWDQQSQHVQFELGQIFATRGTLLWPLRAKDAGPRPVTIGAYQLCMFAFLSVRLQQGTPAAGACIRYVCVMSNLPIM
jgi:hypothetical protein